MNNPRPTHPSTAAFRRLLPVAASTLLFAVEAAAQRAQTTPPDQVVEEIPDLPFDGVKNRLGSRYVVAELASLRYDGTAPNFTDNTSLPRTSAAALLPYAVIEGARAVYLGQPLADSWSIVRARLGTSVLAVEFAGSEADLHGVVYLPDDRGSRLVAHPFRLATATATSLQSTDFVAAQHRHYAVRLDYGLPGAGWWRHRASLDAPDGDATEERTENVRTLEAERSFALFTGGRAVSENLRLDELLDTDGFEVPSVSLGAIVGIRAAPLEWAGYEQCADEGLDPLARFVPADHHAVFFPTFTAMVRVVDELRTQGTPVLDALEPRAEDARVQPRYEAQLGLELDAAARLFGPRVVRAIAATGGDPYLRTGTDLALLFDCRDPEAFQAFVLAGIQTRAKARGLELTERTVGAVTLRGAADGARDLSSWVARRGEIVIVSNSAPLAARLMRVADEKEPSLATLEEYRYFRARYPRGEAHEAAFVVLTDGAIRRWCGPRWRIASARRVRAGALLAEASATHAAMQLGLEPEAQLKLGAAVADFGALIVDDIGPRSERYGTARFLTPIAELEMAYVTPSEQQGYIRWRAGYDRQWSNAFDPIAAQLVIEGDALRLDLTVMPIALRTDYREMLDIAGEARLSPFAGDPHPDALAHAVLAVDRDAPAVRQLDGLLQSVLPGVDRPFGWIGDHFAIWLDSDPELMAALRAAEDRDEFFEEHGFSLPIGVQLAVREPLRLASFLAAIKGLVMSAAPGAMEWQTRELELESGTKRAYVAVVPQEGSGWEQTPSLYYAILPGRFLASLREDVLQRAIARGSKPKADDTAATQQVANQHLWLGESFAVRFQEGFREVLTSGLVENELRDALQRRAFMALPILNELRHVAPDREPRELQVELFGSTVRCPGGGTFVWNEAYGSYMSTVFGCPAEPLESDVLPEALEALRALDLGLTFERLLSEAEGRLPLYALRARASLERAPVGAAPRGSSESR